MEQIKLTREELNILKKYENIFERIIKEQSFRGISINISKEIASIVDKNRRRAYNWGCSSCIYALYMRAARIYKYNLELLEKEQNSESEKQEAADNQPPEINDQSSDKNNKSKDGAKKRKTKLKKEE